MVWPPQSPDLNPIEQVWDLLDSLLNKHINTSAANLWNQLQTAWKSIAEETLQKYINTMNERCIAVIEAKGGHTRY